MKNLLIPLLFLTSASLFSQNYKFEKIIANGIILKGKGDVFVSDSIITITYKNKKKIEEQNYKVINKNQNGTTRQYTSIVEKNITPLNIRITIKENDIYKRTPYFLIIDSVDEFTNQSAQVTYLMKLID